MIDILVKNLKTYMAGVGFGRVVVGLSGGIDSALSAAIAARALGRENVFLYFMPYKTSNPQSKKDAQLMANHLNIPLYEIDITPMAEPYISQNNPMCNVRMGNILSRLRMAILFDKSVFHNALVLGTANKSEILLGYITWFGDSACSVNPLGNLYKTQVWQMSRDLGIPAKLIEKAPSADHTQGQTDENDLGYAYKDIDKLLERLYEQGETEDEIIKSGADADFVRSISRRVNTNGYKQKLPIIL